MTLTENVAKLQTLIPTLKSDASFALSLIRPKSPAPPQQP
jgi:hypothetical protein